jgi:benzoylformate decarboxylase
MLPYVVFKHLGHQAIYSAADVRKQHENIRAIVISRQRAFDGIDLSANSLDARNKFLLFFFDVGHNSLYTLPGYGKLRNGVLILAGSTARLGRHSICRLLDPYRERIAELTHALAASKKPALVVGSEVDRQDAYALTVALAEHLNTPVFEAPNSSRSSFPEDHRLFAGFLPAIPEHLSDALQSFDLVLVIGAPVFSFHVPGKAAIFEFGPRIFQITDNPLSAVRSQATDTIVSSMVPALTAMLQRLPRSSRQEPRITRRIVPVAAKDPIQPEFAMQEIARAVGHNVVVVEEAPSYRPAMQKHLPILRPKGFYTMASGGLGWGLPAAVGVVLAENSR